MSSIIAVIPARYHSRRFPGKLLVDLGGKPLIYRTWAQTCKCSRIDEVIVATDDERIKNAVLDFGGKAVMTSKDVASGSDRIAEVIRDMEVDIIVNVQGDEPQIDPETLSRAIDALEANPDCDVATARVAIRHITEFKSPDVVKVVCDLNNRALYFSRSPLPNRVRSKPEITETSAVWGYKHLGIYVFRKEALLKFTEWKPSPLEKMEKLEQLRLLENGRKIILVETERESIGVDTREELEQLREAMGFNNSSKAK